jgi:hypothetical protein
MVAPVENLAPASPQAPCPPAKSVVAKKHPARRIPASLHFMQGYACALNHVADALAECDSLTPDQVHLRCSLYDFLNKLRPDEDSLKLKPTNRQLADKYTVSPRTVTNWRKEGCPFEDGQPHVLNWATKQRLLPRRFKVKFAQHLQKRRKKEEQRKNCDTLEATQHALRQLEISGKMLGIL